jgi:iron-sulfur cluster repair protein YtfE (RIC family)
METTDTGAGRAELARTTLHEIVSRRPGAREVLLGFGLDLCCGGELPLEEAARLHGLDLGEILEALGAGPDGGARRDG